MTPALTQIVASPGINNQVQGSSGATAGAVIRSSLPGTVQVIQGHPFMQQQYTQQQYYIQSVQGMFGAFHLCFSLPGISANTVIKPQRSFYKNHRIALWLKVIVWLVKYLYDESSAPA